MNRIQYFTNIVSCTAFNLLFAAMLSVTRSAQADDSTLYVTKISNTQVHQISIAIQRGSLAATLSNKDHETYKVLEVRSISRETKTRILFRLNHGSYRPVKFFIEQIRAMYHLPSSEKLNSQVEASSYEDLSFGSSSPLTNSKEDSSSPKATDPNSLVPKCAAPDIPTANLAEKIRTDAIARLISKTCSSKDQAKIILNIARVTNINAPVVNCLAMRAPATMAAFESYWSQKISSAKNPIVACDQEAKTSNFKDGSIVLGVDAIGKDDALVARIVLHEMLHAELSSEQKVRALEGCSENRDAVVAADTTAVDHASQAKPITAKEAAAQPGQTTMDASNLLEVHQFIADAPTSVSIISHAVSGSVAQLASNLELIPAAQAAIRRDENASDIAGAISYDKSGASTITLSTGQAFSRPFASISATEIQNAIELKASSDSRSLGAASQAAGQTSAMNPIGSGSAVKSSGSNTMQTTSSRAPTSALPDFSKLSSAGEARKILLDPKFSPTQILNESAFQQKLQTFNVQILSRSQKKAWGATKPVTRWDLDEMLKARDQR